MKGPPCVDVDAHDRGPVGALVERQQVPRERHRQGEDQQHNADDPVQLARVLVGAEEERPRPCAGRSGSPSRSSPTCACRARTARGTLRWSRSGSIRRRRRRGRGVVHRQEDAGDGLVEEREQRRRAQRVEPVGPLRHLAEHRPARPAPQSEVRSSTQSTTVIPASAWRPRAGRPCRCPAVGRGGGRG